MKTGSVHLCVNDYHGNFTGCLERVDVYERPSWEPLIEIMGPLIDDEGGEYGSTRIAYHHATHHVEIEGRFYRRIAGTWGNMVGNVYWDCFEMDEMEAKRLVADLLADGGWSVEVSCEGWHERDLRDIPPPVVDDGTQLELFAEVA